MLRPPNCISIPKLNISTHALTNIVQFRMIQYTTLEYSRERERERERTEEEEESFRPYICLLYTSPSPRDGLLSRMPSSA